MKKLLVCLLATMLCLCNLTSCEAYKEAYKENVFFSNSLLKRANLEDMPVPPGADSDAVRDGNTLYLNLTEQEYKQYVFRMLEYLQAKKDIYYLGYSYGDFYSQWLLNTPIYPLTTPYVYGGGNDHSFFFSNENNLAYADHLINPIEIEIERKTGQLSFKNYEYNTLIRVKTVAFATASWSQCGAGHTYDEGVEYPIAGSDKTVPVYSCIHCSAVNYPDFTNDMEDYPITIKDTDAKQYLTENLGGAPSGAIISVGARKPTDSDLKFIANGTEILPREGEDGLWIYEFIMPCEDVVITTEIVENTPSAN